MEMMRNEKRPVTNLLGQCGRTLSLRLMPIVVLLMILLSFTSAAFAQLTTADILGTVTDSTGAVIRNANVTLVNFGTNEERSPQSNGSGDYSFTLLPVGHYSVTVKAPGFQASI